MSLRDVMAYVQKQQAAGAAVTPVTPENSTGLQRKPAWIGAVTPVTPVTPHLYEVGAATPIERTEAAASSHDVNPAPAPPAPEALDWHALDMAYQNHHFKCPICIAAGRGIRYGLRCGVGAALWTAYEDAARATPMPWHQTKKGRND